MAARSTRAMSLTRCGAAVPDWRGPHCAPARRHATFDVRCAVQDRQPEIRQRPDRLGPINGARPMHGCRPPPCRVWCALAPSEASPCILSPSLCSSGTLTGRQRQCPACSYLQQLYRQRRVDKTAYAHSPELGLHVATYTEYLASQVMAASRTVVGQHVLKAESSADAEISSVRAAAAAVQIFQAGPHESQHRLGSGLRPASHGGISWQGRGSRPGAASPA